MMSTVNQSLTIRRATIHDCTAIADLSVQLGYPSTSAQIAERLTMIEKDSRHEVFVAENNNTVVGWVHIVVELHLESGSFAEIVGLVVDEHHRNASVGRQLVESAEQWAQGRGCNEMRVRTNVVRERAHKFYEQRSYQLKKQQKVFGKTLRNTKTL